mmetsp:Transcript_1996/g.7220  ORF Transcript_1996/g.7220 Transcript_1996/m.7220 type:complete len:390 (-) Transcript_1996:726-1895(-)
MPGHQRLLRQREAILARPQPHTTVQMSTSSEVEQRARPFVERDGLEVNTAVQTTASGRGQAADAHVLAGPWASAAEVISEEALAVENGQQALQCAVELLSLLVRDEDINIATSTRASAVGSANLHLEIPVDLLQGTPHSLAQEKHFFSRDALLERVVVLQTNLLLCVQLCRVLPQVVQRPVAHGIPLFRCLATNSPDVREEHQRLLELTLAGILQSLQRASLYDLANLLGDLLTNSLELPGVITRADRMRVTLEGSDGLAVSHCPPLLTRVLLELLHLRKNVCELRVGVGRLLESRGLLLAGVVLSAVPSDRELLCFHLWRPHKDWRHFNAGRRTGVCPSHGPGGRNLQPVVLYLHLLLQCPRRHWSLAREHSAKSIVRSVLWLGFRLA